MGAFDHLSDNDERVIAHENRHLRNEYSKSLSEYSTDELKSELKRRKSNALKMKKEQVNDKVLKLHDSRGSGD